MKISQILCFLQRGGSVCRLQCFFHPAVFSHYSQRWRSPRFTQHTADPSQDTARTKSTHCHLRRNLNMDDNTEASLCNHKSKICRKGEGDSMWPHLEIWQSVGGSSLSVLVFVCILFYIYMRCTGSKARMRYSWHFHVFYVCYFTLDGGTTKP